MVDTAGKKDNSSVTPVKETPDGDNKNSTNKVDNDKDNTVVRPADVKPPVDNTEKPGSSQIDDKDKADKSALSKNVVSTVPNKTPSELAAETPAQTASRYGVDQTVTDEDADNPRVDVYRDTHVNQVPSGTHLHPDIAKDLLNRGISEQHTDNAQVKRTTTEYYSFAGDAEHNDKFVKPAEDKK